MKFNNLEELMRINSAVTAGFDFFQNNPLEYIRLVELNHTLALSYAKDFPENQMRAMLDKAYGRFVNDKFFTELLSIDPNNVAFKNMVSDKDMLDFFKTKRLTSLHITNQSSGYKPIYLNGYEYNYAFFYDDHEQRTPIAWGIQPNNFMDSPHWYDTAGLERKYREATENKDIKWRILLIATALIKKIDSKSTVLDAEFKEEEAFLSNKSTTNRVFPILFSWPVDAMTEIVALLMERCSKNIVCEQMVAINSKTKESYFRFIIDNYPKTNLVYNIVYKHIKEIALEGRSAFKKYLDKIVFDVVDILFDKDQNRAEEFYNLGQLCLKPNSNNVNPINSRWSVGTKKIMMMRCERNNKSDQDLVSTELHFFAPPTKQQPAYNPELNYNTNFQT